KLGLYLKADLENVTDLLPAEDFEWNFKDTYEMNSSRGSANLVMRCKFCKRDMTASFEPSFKIKKYDAENSGKFQQIAQFDCRGMELVDFQPKEPWSAKGLETNSVFEDIDLTEGEWADYDEKAGEPVAINNIEVEFRTEK
ncbi:hypothetical protein BDF20DRAFT_827477, partial [Mycotypha africana]|uniref:uncharacterized protein n=1 Tax=Mycotypha africana TaxID=64632 RepID=UPI00230109FB